MLGRHVARKPVNGVEQTDRECRACAHSASGGQVPIVLDCYALPDVEELQDFSDGWMVDLVEGIGRFDLRVGDSVPVLEERREVAARNPAIFVDGRREDRAAVVSVPGRVIGSASEERESERSSRDDHRYSSDPLTVACTQSHRLRFPHMLDLYTWPTPNGKKVPILLAELDWAYELHLVNLGRDEQHRQEYLAINPNGKIPALVDTEGTGGRLVTVF